MDSAKVESNLLYRGAEADLFLSQLGPWKVVIKQRVKKGYRNSDLDTRIRKERTVREATGLREAKRAGVRTPSVVGIDMPSCSITMTFVEGHLARDQLGRASNSKTRDFLRELGVQIGKLHQHGWVHGDLTTSNIILCRDGRPFILDFGMTSHSAEAEDRGVDLHLLQRSLATCHSIDARSCTRAVFPGYRQSLGSREAELTLRKQAEIARRGRYFAFR